MLLMAEGGITRDKAATLNAAGGTSLSLTWAVNPTPGSKVIVAATHATGGTTVLSVTDNGTTPATFTLDRTVAGGAHPMYFYRVNNITLPASGSYVVTFNYSGASGGATGWGQSYLGVAGRRPVLAATAG